MNDTKCPKCGKAVTGYRYHERDGLCVNCLIDAYVELMGKAQAAIDENAALRAWCNEASVNIARLRDAIEAMVSRDFEIRHFSARVFPYPTEPGWYWSFVRGGEYVKWVGPFNTAADAALDGTQEAAKAMKGEKVRT
jgi:hypothetical protein